MSIKGSRIRRRHRREVALGLVNGYIKYYGNSPKTTLRGMSIDEKYCKTRLRQLAEQKEVLEERIKNNMGRA